MCFSLEVIVKSASKTWYMKEELKWCKGYETESDEFEDLMR